MAWISLDYTAVVIEFDIAGFARDMSVCLSVCVRLGVRPYLSVRLILLTRKRKIIDKSESVCVFPRAGVTTNRSAYFQPWRSKTRSGRWTSERLKMMHTRVSDYEQPRHWQTHHSSAGGSVKLFRTSNRDIINECCSHFCFKLPSEILPARFDRFLCKLRQQLRL